MKRSILGLLLIVGFSSTILAGNRFVRDDTNKVVADTKTNLTWQDDSDAKTITKNWKDAIDYCENLSLGGYSNWHLPNYNELYSIADRSRYNPSINPTFVNVVNNGYWSSTTRAIDDSDAWGVSFYGNGGDGWYDESKTYHVRCVRDNNL